MNICYVTGAQYPSPAANCVQVMKMCSAFSGEGHDVTLFAGSKPGVQLTDVSGNYGVKNKFEIVLAPRKSVRILGAILYSLSQYRNIVDNKNTYDLIYSRDQNTLLLLTRLGVPVIYEAHDDPKGSKAVIEGMIFKSKAFKRLVVITSALKELYLSKFSSLTPESIIVAHDGADSFVINEGGDVQNIKKNGVISIGYTGHLYKGKGVEVIVELASQMSDVDFHIVGGNPSDVTEWKNLYNYPNLTYHGHVENKLVNGYLKQFDILLLPAQKKVEASGGGDIAKYMSPLKLFEYMSSGKPIVSSNLPVLREVLTPETDALLVVPDNVAEWEAAIKRLINDPELGVALAGNALQKFELEYTWGRRAYNILNDSFSR